jgi:hypothetical protein
VNWAGIIKLLLYKMERNNTIAIINGSGHRGFRVRRLQGLAWMLLNSKSQSPAPSTEDTCYHALCPGERAYTDG